MPINWEQIGVEQVVKGNKKFLRDMAAYDKSLVNSSKKTGQYSKFVSDASTKSDSFGKQILKLGAAFGLGSMLYNGLKNAIRGVTEFAKASIETAGNVAEMESKFNVTFGNAAPQATAELEKFADAANRSSIDLKEMAAEVQTLFVPLGFTRDAASDMSVALTQLAVDVGSFNNKAQADVINDFKSALVGSHETVKKYGVVLNDATLKAELLRMGVEGGTRAASEQEKVQARLNLIYEGTIDAQGDAIRTADSYANVSEGLSAATKDLSNALGKLLVPSATKAKVALTGLAKTITGYVEKEVEVMVATQRASKALNEGIITYKEFEAVRRGFIDITELLGEVTEDEIETREAAIDVTSRLAEYEENITLTLEEQALAIIASAETTDILKQAREAGIITEYEYQLAILQTKEGLEVETEALAEQIKELKNSTQAEEDAKTASEDLAKAQDTAAKAADNHALAQFALSESLKGATRAQSAAVFIGLLTDALKGATGETRDNLLVAIDDMNKAYGITDEKSDALTTGLGTLRDILGEGAIEADLAAEAFDLALTDPLDAIPTVLEEYGKIPSAFEDMIISSEEAQFVIKGENEKIADNTIENMGLVETAVEGAIEDIDNLALAFLNLNFIIQRSNTLMGSLGNGGPNIFTIPTPPGGGGSGLEAFYIGGGQHGLDTIIGPGFPNDSLRLKVDVTSGERLTITPAAEVRNPGSTSFSSVTHGATNEYNLTVITSQAPNLVVRSYEMMQLLGG
jgi:hypothetical protein